MKRAAYVAGMTAMLLVVPASAYAASSVDGGPVSVVAGLATLLAATVLLVAALLLERVARGSAIADNISYVVGAAICLGASALVRWITRLVPSGLPMEQAALSSDLLTIAAITLFSVYFFRVRASLRRFLHLAGVGEAELARAQVGEMPDEAERTLTDAAPGAPSAEDADG